MASAKTVTAPQVTGPEIDINGIEVYSVKSRTSSDVYQVLHVDGRTICCCKASQFGRHCAHVAAVDKARWQAETAATKAHADHLRDTAPLARDNKPFSIWKS